MNPKKTKLEEDPPLLSLISHKDNDAFRDISSYFVEFLNDQDKGLLRKVNKTFRTLSVLKFEKECSNLTNYAAKHGFLYLLQWANQNGCPWDERTCAYAAEKGHLEILQWARQNGCPE